MGKQTQQPKAQVRARDGKGRFVKRQKPRPLPPDVLKQLGYGLVRVGNIAIPIQRAVLVDTLDDSNPWIVVDRKETP
jgi:hypothetical protein